MSPFLKVKNLTWKAGDGTDIANSVTALRWAQPHERVTKEGFRRPAIGPAEMFDVRASRVAQD